MEKKKIISIALISALAIIVVIVLAIVLNIEKEIEESFFRDTCKESNLEITEEATGYAALLKDAKKSISATDEIIKAEWYYYESEDKAKEAFSNISEIIKYAKGNANNNKAELESTNKYMIYKKTGKVIVSVESDNGEDSIKEAKEFAKKLNL